MCRKHLLFFTNLFPTPAQPTRGVFKFQLARALQATFDVTVVCPLPWFPRVLSQNALRRWNLTAEVPRRYQWQSLSVHAPRYPMIPYFSRSVHAQMMFRGVWTTVQRLNQRRPFDLANSHWLYPDGVVAQQLCESFGIPHIATGSGCDVNEFLRHPRKRASIVHLLRRAAHTIAVSEPLRERMIESGGASARITAIPNGVDTRAFTPLDREQARVRLGLSPNLRFILFAGRLSEEKGVRFLPEAFARSTSGFGTSHLLIVGDGPLRAHLATRVCKLGISDRVTFFGSVDHAEMAIWMNAADVLCLPSLREGCPNVVLEALACGTPVVASDVGGVSRFVNQSNGFLTTPGNVSALAGAISDALNRDWDHVAISRAMAPLSRTRQASRYSDLLFAILANHGQVRPQAEAVCG